MGARKQKITMAAQADKHELYERSVQCSEFEIDWVTDTFEAMRGRPLRQLREDFCGTANAACEYVQRHEDNYAVGVDLDASVLAWGKSHHIAEMSDEDRHRLTLIEDDVKVASTPNMDAVLAMNFSYWLFDNRPSLLEYFRHAHSMLKDDGILFMDAFGGYEAFNDDQEEETDHDDFSYVWYLKRFNPINNQAHYQIIFRFPDGSEINPAFDYVWRHWSLPEIKELLEEAGFKKVIFYMQGWDEDGEEPSNDFDACEEADADAGWVAYITAEK